MPAATLQKPVAPKVGKHAGGRPTKRSEALAELICDRISKGEALSEICDPEDLKRPCSYVFVWEWQRDDPEFAKKFASAREVQAEFYADECMRIADAAHDRDSSSAARIQIDARLRRAAHLKPKTFRDDASPSVVINQAMVMDEPTRLRLIERLAELRAESGLEKPVKVIEG